MCDTYINFENSELKCALPVVNTTKEELCIAHATTRFINKKYFEKHSSSARDYMIERCWRWKTSKVHKTRKEKSQKKNYELTSVVPLSMAYLLRVP